jgi:hypothetical protein
MAKYGLMLILSSGQRSLAYKYKELQVYSTLFKLSQWPIVAIETILCTIKNMTKSRLDEFYFIYIEDITRRREDMTFYLRVVKTICYERAQRVSKILFLTRKDKSHIFKSKVAGSNPSRGQVEFSACPVLYTRVES